MRPELIVLLAITFVSIICVGWSHASSPVEASIRFGSFNIQAFGRSKVKKPEVMSVIAQIARRYDILLVLEIRDKSGDAMEDFLEIVNEDFKEPIFKMEQSDLLGRGHYKEKCGYLYNSKTVRLIQTTEFPDQPDHWERNPFLATFHLPTASIENVTIIGMHVKPDDVESELNSVPAVVEFAQKKWNSENILLAGDLNCDCTYISPEEFDNLKIRNDPHYRWLIDRCAKRTAISTNCMYDRIIAVGPRLQQSVVTGSAVVVPFDQEFNLTLEQALNVSDHRPVECQISGKISGNQRPVISDWSFAVHQNIDDAQQKAVRAIYRAADLPAPQRGHFSVTMLKKGSRNYQVLADRFATEVLPALEEFDRVFPDVLSRRTKQAVAAYEPKLLQPPQPCDASTGCRRQRLRIDCIMEAPWRCAVVVTTTLTTL